MRTLLALATLIAVSVVSGVARSDESKVPVSEVPQGGLEAAKAMFPGATVSGVAKETEDAKTVFEVTLKHNGKNIDVTIGLDGKIQVIEREIADKDLPAAVKKTLDAKYPKATRKILEEVSSVKDGKPTLDFFEALLVTANQETLEVQIEPDGKVRKEEKKTE